MEFKGTKGNWKAVLIESNPNNNNCVNHSIDVDGGQIIDIWARNHHKCKTIEEATANAKLIASAPEMLELINDLTENLALQLDRLGCCGEGDGKDRKADNDSYGGNELLVRSRELIKKSTE